MSKKRMIVFIFALCLFIAATGLVLYFINSDLFIQEFDADVPETVLWADAAITSGSLVNPDFTYTQLLPFGGQLLMIPIVRHFGVTMRSLRLGMSIIAVLFACLSVGFFRSLHWESETAFAAAGLILLFFSSTKDLRYIFWEHIVFYNLSLLFLMGAYILLSAVMDGKSPIPAAILLALTVFLGSGNGAVLVCFFSLPLLAAVFLEDFPENLRNKKALTIPLLIGISLLAGLLTYRRLSAGMLTGYSDQYSVIAPAESWSMNLSRLPKRWVNLFTALPEEEIVLFGSAGIKLTLRIFCAILTAVLPIFACFCRFQTRQERVFLRIHWLLCAETMFFFVFGEISNMSWRMIPMLFSALTVSLMTIREYARNGGTKLCQVTALAFAAVFSACCLLSGASLIKRQADTSLWYGPNTILTTLREHGLNYGYSMDFWFSNSLTLLTDGETTIREVTMREGKPAIPRHLNNIHWYADKPGQDKYFLILQENEYFQFPEFSETALETYRCTQERTFIRGTAGYFILVYDYNIMSEAYQALLRAKNL